MPGVSLLTTRVSREPTAHAGGDMCKGLLHPCQPTLTYRAAGLPVHACKPLHGFQILRGKGPLPAHVDQGPWTHHLQPRHHQREPRFHARVLERIPVPPRPCEAVTGLPSACNQRPRRAFPGRCLQLGGPPPRQPGLCSRAVGGSKSGGSHARSTAALPGPADRSRCGPAPCGSCGPLPSTAAPGGGVSGARGQGGSLTGLFRHVRPQGGTRGVAAREGPPRWKTWLFPVKVRGNIWKRFCD